MKKTITAAAFLLAITACGTSSKKPSATPGSDFPAAPSASSAPSPSPSAKLGSPPPAPLAPNPVDVLRVAGVETKAGASVGSLNTDGTKEASGDVYATEEDRATDSGEVVNVTTYPTNDMRDVSSDFPAQSDDGTVKMFADRAFITVTGVDENLDGAIVFPLPPQTIATRLNATLIPTQPTPAPAPSGTALERAQALAREVGCPNAKIVLNTEKPASENFLCLPAGAPEKLGIAVYASKADQDSDSTFTAQELQAQSLTLIKGPAWNAGTPFDASTFWLGVLAPYGGS